MINEKFEHWAKEQEWDAHLGRTTDGKDYAYLQTARCHDAYVEGRHVALTEAAEICESKRGARSGIDLAKVEILSLCDGPERIMERKALTGAELAGLHDRLGGRPEHPTVNTSKVPVDWSAA